MQGSIPINRIFNLGKAYLIGASADGCNNACVILLLPAMRSYEQVDFIVLSFLAVEDQLSRKFDMSGVNFLESL